MSNETKQRKKPNMRVFDQPVDHDETSKSTGAESPRRKLTRKELFECFKAKVDAWRVALTFPYAPTDEDSGFFAAVILGQGGYVVLDRLHSNDPEESVGMQRQMLLAEAGFASLLSRWVETLISANVEQGPIAIEEIQKLVNIKKSLCQLQQSNMQAAASLLRRQAHIWMFANGPKVEPSNGAAEIA